MLRRTFAVSPPQPTTPSSSSILASSSLFQSFCFFTREDRTQPKANSSRVRGQRRHPLEKMRQRPSNRNVSIPDAVHEGGGGDESAPAGSSSSSSHSSRAAREFAMRPAQMQQSILRRSEQLDRDEQLLWQGAVISDTRNPIAEHIGKLHSNPQYRQSQKRFLLTGKHLMEEAIRLSKKNSNIRGGGVSGDDDIPKPNRLRPKHLLVRSDREVPEWASRMRSSEIVKVKPHVLDALYPGNDGFVGDFLMPDPPMKEELMVNRRKFRSVLVLDNIDDPGLLGNMVRSAAAFAYDAVFLVNKCADWYHHEVLKASRGVHFQTLTPVYVLKEENGDDVAAMLNHIVERNELVPLLLAPSPASSGDDDAAYFSSAASTSPYSSLPDNLSPIARAALEREQKQQQQQNTKLVEGGEMPQRLQSPPQRKTLHQLMLDSYCGWSEKDAAAEQEGKAGAPDASVDYHPRHHMLCVSTDGRGNFEARMQKMITAKKPTTLLLEDEDDAAAAGATTDVIEAFPMALYQLRHTASWDFLPATMRTSDSTSTGAAIGMSTSTLGESDFPHEGPGPQSDSARNLSEDEYAHKVRAHKADRMHRRIHRLRDTTDEDVWRKFEHDRLKLEVQGEQARRAASPLDDPAEVDARLARRRAEFSDRRERSQIPDEIIERQELMNRDVLKELETWASEYEAPKNYEHRSRTPRWAPEQWPEEERQKAGERRMMRERRQQKYEEAAELKRSQQQQRDDA